MPKFNKPKKLPQFDHDDPVNILAVEIFDKTDSWTVSDGDAFSNDWKYGGAVGRELDREYRAIIGK